MRWYDFRAAYDKSMPFTVIVGGRGIGKTYGAIDVLTNEIDEDNINKILFMRRSGTQAKKCATGQFNPYKSWNADHGRNIVMDYSPEYGVGYISEKDEETEKVREYGYLSSLSTFSGMRGVDLSDVDVWLYDEFTQTKSDRTFIADEGFTFADAYETISRNRELIGKPPVRVFLLTNSNSFYHPIIQYFGWIPYFEKLLREEKNEIIVPNRGLYLQYVTNSEVSEAKKNTALYKALGEKSDFTKFSLDSEFTDLYTGNIRDCNITEYKPICSINDYIFIYQHKGRNEFYICSKRANCQYKFNNGNIKRFLIQFYPILKRAELSDLIFYESLTIQYAYQNVISR